MERGEGWNSDVVVDQNSSSRIMSVMKYLKNVEKVKIQSEFEVQYP